MIKHAILGTLQASLLLVAIGMPQLQQASAQAPTTLGVDVEVDGNTPTSIASVETCTSVEVGDTFPVDIYITDVERLVAFELYFGFNGAVVEIVEHDLWQFLASAPRSNLVTEKDPVPNSTGRHFLGAADTKSPETGSGVLVRLTLTAKAEGRSAATILTPPPDYLLYFRPILTNSYSQHIGDIDGDQRFDGPISKAEIAVGEPCSQPSPPPEPGTTPTPTPTGTPTLTPTPHDALVLALSEDLPPSLSSLSDAPTAEPGEGQPDAEATPDSDRAIESDTTPVPEEGSAGEGGATPAAGGSSPPVEGGGSDGPPLWLFVPLGLLGLAAFTGGLLAIWSMREPGRRG